MTYLGLNRVFIIFEDGEEVARAVNRYYLNKTLSLRKKRFPHRNHQVKEQFVESIREVDPEVAKAFSYDKKGKPVYDPEYLKRANIDLKEYIEMVL